MTQKARQIPRPQTLARILRLFRRITRLSVAGYDASQEVRRRPVWPAVFHLTSRSLDGARRSSMITVVFGSVLPWLLIAIGTWLAYELVRQNGRVLLRLEAIEKSIGPRAIAEQREALGLPLGTIAPDFWLPDLAGVRHTLSEFREHNALLIFFNPQ